MMLNGSAHSRKSRTQGDLDLSLLLDAPGGTLLLILVSVKSWKASLVHGGIRGITGDAGSVGAHSRRREPAEGRPISRVRSRYTCLVTACAAAAQWGNCSHGLLLSFFPPMISLQELSWARRGFDIKSSLQIMFFS